MSVIKQSFGTTGNGLPASLYVIDNGKSQISVTDYGATLVSVVVPDRNGVMADVALGFDSVTGYETSNYQGATVGPYCNRIAGGKFSIDGAEYDLVRNENGVTMALKAITTKDFTKGSTFYHRTDVSPRWAAQKDFTAQYGSHKFYK